jgi:hypothetical protein
MNITKKTALFLTILCVLASILFAEDDDATLQKAFVKTMLGTVEVNSITAAKWRAARAGMMVKMGWTIRTYVESSADIEFETGTMLKIGENSVVTLEKLVKDNSAQATKSNVKVATGKIWANVKKLTNTKSEFEFETPTAVASIRGTKLGIEVDKGGTQLDVYEGLVVVRPRGGAGKEVSVSTRNRAIIGDGGHAIRVIQMTEKDSVKGQTKMKDPFADTTGTKKIDALLDTADRSAKDTTSTAPVTLDILSPTTGTIVKDNQVVIKGKASVNASVEIGGKEVVVDKDGNFSGIVECALGKNTFQVTAKRQTSSKSTDCVVEYRPQLTMNVANILDNMEITSSDITVDVEVSDGAKYSINGKTGATKVTLTPGKNTVTVKAWDQWNTTLEKTFTITYTKTTSFSLTVASPKDQSVVRDPLITVSGSTTPGAKVTVNGTPVVPNVSGFFTYSIPLADEAQEYTVKVLSKLGDDEASEERTVLYTPPKPPLTLTVTSPVDGQLIRTNLLRISGKTTPRAKIMINSKSTSVSSAGVFSSDILLSEKDIGDYAIDIDATDDSTEITKIINVKIDPTSPQINTSIPTLSVPMLGNILASRTQKMLVSVFDKTLDDQITLDIQNNSSTEELVFQPGDQQYFNLEEGKNVFVIKAYDKAKNMSNVVSGTLYYLPGPLSIDLIEPSDNVVSIDDLPPMPKNFRGPKITVQVEVNDGIRNVPETIRYVRIIDNTGRTTQMLDKKNYKYEVELPLVRGANSFQIVTQDIAENMGTKKFDIIIK